MPRKNCHSQQAKAQRASGKRVFDSAFTNDLIEKLFDPDYAPEIGELEEEISDSDEENLTRNFAFSLVTDNKEGAGHRDIVEEDIETDEEEDFTDLEEEK